MRYLGRTTAAVAVAVAAAVVLQGQSAPAAGGAAPPPDVAQRVIQQTTGSTASDLTGTRVVSDVTVQQASTRDGAKLRTLLQARPGSVSVFAILSQGQSEARFGGMLPAGERFEPSADGGLLTVNAKDQVTGRVAPPWAKDAAGKSLPTTYSVDKGVIVQTVDTAGAVYPIVADPTVRPGTHAGVVPVYRVQFDWTETTRMYRNVNAGEAVVREVCGLIPVDSVASWCRIVTTVFTQDLRNNLNAAVQERRCLKLRIPANPVPALFWAYDAYRVTCTR